MSIPETFHKKKILNNILFASPNSGNEFFLLNELKTIYTVSAPIITSTKNAWIISFGGGLFGTIDPISGELTNGDVQTFWTDMGIAPENMPKVYTIFREGTVNNTTNVLATVENTLDIETLGGVCPTSNLNIILLVYPTNVDYLDDALTFIKNNITYPPNVISISWGIAEYYNEVGNTRINSNNLMGELLAMGVNTCIASGDNGSYSDNNNPNILVARFPSTCSNSISCGATNLVSSNKVYDNQTTETGWSGSGGGQSYYFDIPNYQSQLTLGYTKRTVPDIASCGGENSPVYYYINGIYELYYGTSIVAPFVAGYIVSRGFSGNFNDYCYLSTNNTYFHDITNGYNGRNIAIDPNNYKCLIGYDLVTGWGSLKYNLFDTLLTTIPCLGISLDVSTLDLDEGDTYQLVVTFNPTNCTNKNVTFSSNNTDVATVSNTGLITAINDSIYNATITVTSQDRGHTDTVIVTIIKHVTGFSIDQSSVTLNASQRYNLTYSITPLDATNGGIMWTSSDYSIATITAGTITGVSAGGPVTITGTTNDGDFHDTCEVTVLAGIRVVGISFSLASITLSVGETYQLVPIFNPSNATNKVITMYLESGGPSADVNINTGLVTAISAAAPTIITAISQDGDFEANITVSVNPPFVDVTAISLGSTTLSLFVGYTYTFVPVFTPTNATTRTVTYTTSSTKIATITSSGVVKGITVGTSIITVKSYNNKVSTCTVKVTKLIPVSSVSLSKTSANIKLGAKLQLTGKISPTTASIKTVTWTSSSNTIATVVNGLVTGIKKGTATITVRTTNGGKTKKCIVKII
jgi:uncharacterized protein YjdB